MMLLELFINLIYLGQLIDLQLMINFLLKEKDQTKLYEK